MMTKTMIETTDLATEIAAAERELDAAQNRWRNRPRGTPMMSGPLAPIRIDPIARAAMLDLGLAVDAAVIKLEELKRQKAEARLAELLDPEMVAAEDSAVEIARRDMDEAEARATEARIVWQHRRGAQVQRKERVKTMQAKIARASAAIAAAERTATREQSQRDELVVA
jgi:hypothetical protein